MRSDVFYKYLPSADVVVSCYCVALVESNVLIKWCIVISDYDELTEQMVKVFDIEQVKADDFILELDSWHL